jgi:carboxymethylenebutenolidase
VNEQSVAVPRSGGKAMEAFLVHPEGGDRLPGMVVVHEILGLNDDIRDIARRFASAGYAALAVDLFSTGSRAICMLRLFHGMLIRPLNNGVVGDLRHALAYLGGLPQVDAARIGAVGFCLGGTFALQLACVEDDLKASAVFYGMNPRPLEAVAQACPIVGSYPEEDFTARAARQLEPALERYDIPHDIKIYPGAKHSFFNQGARHDPEAAEDAWERMNRFFEEYL